MTHFLCKLLPPRPTFPHDMTPDEAETRALTDADPVSRAGLGFVYEIHAMPRTAVRPAPTSTVLQPT